MPDSILKKYSTSSTLNVYIVLDLLVLIFINFVVTGCFVNIVHHNVYLQLIWSLKTIIIGKYRLFV